MENLRQLDMTRDEVNRIGEALKDKEFRKLLVDYVEELQNPENKRLYEEEVKELEKQRGFDVTFIHPIPGYVIKTSVDGSKKTFINVCASELIQKPTSTPSREKGSRGLQWSIPHSPSPPREDVDKKRLRCVVFDVVFHPDTLHLAQRNQPFKDMVNNVACQSIEDNYDVKLDKNNLKFPKIQYKGTCDATILRKPNEGPKVEMSNEEKEFLDKLYAEIPQNETPKPKKKQRNPDTSASLYTTPKYEIKHRNHIDIQDYTYDRDCKMSSAIPNELIVEINLPLLSSSADITLDVDEKLLQLISEKPAKYKLNLTLPYAVNQDNGNAKFDKDRKKLLITLPVKRKCSLILSDIGKEDSGVESDHGSLVSSSPLDYESLITEIHSFQPLKEETEVKSIEFAFFNPEVQYTLPEFTTNRINTTLAFTLNVKNVEENSIEKLLSQSSFSLKFTTISSGFYPLYYAFHVNLPQVSFNPSDFTVEVWDNNVIVQVVLEQVLTSVLIGLNEKEMKEIVLEERAINEPVEEPVSIIEFKRCNKDKRKGKQLKKNYNVEAIEEKKDCLIETSRILDVAGLSESSGDELCSSPSKNRGILKNFSRKVPRSVSESNLDDYVIASSMENCCTSLDSIIPEEGQVSTSLKKTVRFNNVVSKQLYRSNSSILGQRKKNQRKSKAKKRAQERRCSESEVSESEEKKETEDENKSKQGNHDIFHLDI